MLTKRLGCVLFCIAFSGFGLCAAQQVVVPASATNIAPSTASNSLLLAAGKYHSPVTLSATDLRAKPHVTVTVHNPHSNADETYSGVPLATLFGELGAPLGKDLHGAALAEYLIATGSDGYRAVFALAEVDPSFHPGDVIVADMMNGKPLDAQIGPFRLVVSEDKRPARWVRNLVSIELKAAD